MMSAMETLHAGPHPDWIMAAARAEVDRMLHRRGYPMSYDDAAELLRKIAWAKADRAAREECEPWFRSLVRLHTFALPRLVLPMSSGQVVLAAPEYPRDVEAFISAARCEIQNIRRRYGLLPPEAA